MTTQMIYELTKTYMIVSGEEIDRTENFRYKMLAANNIKGILPLEIRMINNEKKIYIDVTGKECLLNFLNCRMANREEIRKLFEAIFLISEEVSKFLIGETDVIMRPEMIFKNLITGDYEFICIPLVEEGLHINEGMKSLIHFLMSHIDNKDEKLVESIYTISDLYESSKPKFTMIYDYFTENTREIDMVEEEQENKENEEIVKIHHSVYMPSLKEIAALVMCVVGLVLLGYNLYLSMAV